MLESYLQLCEAISAKDLTKFKHLLKVLEINDLNAFDSVLLKLASFHSAEITQYLLEQKVKPINEKWFDRLIFNDLSLKMTEKYWDLGVRGESALVHSLSSSLNNNVIKFLIDHEAPIKKSDEDEFSNNISQKRYLKLFKNYHFSDSLKEKLENKFNNFPFKVNKKILTKINQNSHYFDNYDITILQPLSAKKLRKLIVNLENKEQFKQFIEKFSLNQIATLNKELCDIIFNLVSRKFNYIPKQLGAIFFINQNIDYLLDNLDYNLEFSLFCYKKLILNQDLNQIKIKTYIDKIIKLEDIDYFLELDPRLEKDYLKYSQNQLQLNSLHDLEQLKQLNCTHPSIFLKALNSKKINKEVIKYLASQVKINDYVIQEGYKNLDVILEFVKRKAPINLLHIYDDLIFQKAIKLIKNPQQYVNLLNYKSHDKIENYKTQFVLNLYLKNKVKSKTALYNILKTDRLDEKTILKLIKKDIENNLEIYSWNYHHNIYGLKYLSNLNKDTKKENKRLLNRHFSGIEFSKEEIIRLMKNNQSYSFKLTTICVAMNNNYPELVQNVPADDLKKIIPYLNPNVKLDTYLKVLKDEQTIYTLVPESIITNNHTLLEAILIQKEKLLLENITSPSNHMVASNTIIKSNRSKI